MAVCSVPIAALTASIYITLSYLYTAPPLAPSSRFHPPRRSSPSLATRPYVLRVDVRKYIQVIDTCASRIYVRARAYVHTGFREVLHKRIIREETSTYLDSSVTSGALVDSHRFVLATRKEKPVKKRREGGGGDEKLFSDFRCKSS